MPENLSIAERTLRGIPASGGVVHARVLRLGPNVPEVVRRELAAAEAVQELNRFREALVATRHQIRDIQSRVSKALGASEGAIFDAHLLVLDDPTFMDEITSGVRDQHLNADFVVKTVADRFASALAAVDDPYLSERAADVRDVAQRLVRNLTGGVTEDDLSRMKEPAIIVAHDLSPSTTALLDRTKVLGFATDEGGVTSHTAIMARKLRLPAVIGLRDVTSQVRTGDDVLLDGHGGGLIINPTDATLYQYGQMRERRAALEVRLADLRSQPAVTLDGVRLMLAANIEDPSDLPDVVECGAEGVGLFRTEFLFLNTPEPPDEETQFQAYRAVAEGLAPAPVVIRTMDLGGDKLPGGERAQEQNPFLGWRAIRISLSQPDLFRTQLRAILRASAHGKVRLMYPMISSLDELRAANTELEACRAELRRNGIPFDEALEVGMMIEVPAAALIARALAPEVSFFSLGTNDLTQYTLAVDRLNQRVAHLHAPTHPGVLRLIQMTVEAAREHGRWVGVCGEAAGDPSMIPLLVGLGVDELSATPAMVPAAKFLLRRLRRSEATAMAQSVLGTATASETLAASDALARGCAPELFSTP
ncbi:MAG: phosphoenolpyruvate--protein phosphotransferase [Verrucomicrobiota bacterium]